MKVASVRRCASVRHFASRAFRAAACVLVLSAGASCSQKGILWVHVLGDSSGLATPIESLRVEVTATRLGESHTTRYPATMGTINLPTDFAYRVTGGLDDGDELVLDVFAEGGGMDLLAGSVTTNFDVRHVVNVDVTLLPLGGCGDGSIEAGEDCDGANVGGLACTDLGYTGGTLACAANCTFDTAACTGNPCGNGVRDLGEDCEGVDLGGALCTDLGFSGGTLACAADCTFDTSACMGNPCGNGAIDVGEDCDGSDLNGADCTTVTGGFVSGTLGCATDCTFDATMCVLATCGDGTIDAGESCDGGNLGGLTCLDAGMFSGGTLACTVACGFDTTACDGPPTAPAPRKPMNNSYLGSIFVPDSLRPTFVWEPSTVTGGATISYEIDYGTDPAFSPALTATAMTSFTNHQPASDLVVSVVAPVGARYYWRVRACAGSACSAWSPTWWVNVGRNDHDVNGDGYADVVVGAPSGAVGSNVGTVSLFFGGPGSGLDTSPDASLVGLSGDLFGYQLAYAGDLNADGCADLIVGAIQNDAGMASTDNRGGAYVYFGAPGLSLDAAPDGTFNGEAAGDSLGWAVAAAGDVNGDGFDDVVVGAPRNDAGGSATDERGAAYVFFGGAGASFDPSPDGTLIGEAVGDQFGAPASGAGDVNGDGYADVVVGAPLNDAGGTDAGRAYLYLGGAGPTFDPAVDATLTAEAAGDLFGAHVGSADANGDGYGDLLVGAQTNDAGMGSGDDRGRAYVYFGGPGSLGATPDATITGEAAGDRFGAVVGAGDVNGDGYEDVIVGALYFDAGMAATDDRGGAYVYLGGPGPFDVVADGTMTGMAAGDHFGTSASAAGDVNGDALADVVVGAPLNDATALNAGAAYLYFGGVGPTFDAVEDGTLTGALASDVFGLSVADLNEAGQRLPMAVICGRRRARTIATWASRPSRGARLPVRVSIASVGCVAAV